MIPTLALLLVCAPPAMGNDLFAVPKALAACAAVLWAFWEDPPTARFVDATPWAALFAALTVSTLLSWDPGYSLVSVEHARGLGLLQWALCALFYLYGRNADRAEVKDAIVWGGGFVAVLALGQVAFLPGRASWGSTQGSPVVLGEVLAVCLPVAWRRGPRAVPYLLAGAAGAVHCRSAMAAMVVSSAYLLWRKKC